MDKQIIIDGIDVSGCPHYIHKDGSCSSHDCECIKCVHNECFYKDYKAKEQECEELKENLPNAITRLMGELDQLKAENKTQKETIDGFLSILDKLGKSNIKLRETLTEIKEIATENSLAQVGYNPDWDIILQKISEVEND